MFTLNYRNKHKNFEKLESNKISQRNEQIIVEEWKIETKHESIKVIKALPEPSSQEGWTAIPEIVKKSKQKRK